MNAHNPDWPIHLHTWIESGFDPDWPSVNGPKVSIQHYNLCVFKPILHGYGSEPG